mmetsp:Transcript_2921/g.6868  ORF Transcript_2921/g.6868 Transcript_2921/m.6868 type:complete len:256 (+) Transcript_2921:737-1504(+)
MLVATNGSDSDGEGLAIVCVLNKGVQDAGLRLLEPQCEPGYDAPPGGVAAHAFGRMVCGDVLEAHDGPYRERLFGARGNGRATSIGTADGAAGRDSQAAVIAQPCERREGGGGGLLRRQKVAHVRPFDGGGVWVMENHPGHQTTESAVGGLGRGDAIGSQGANEPRCSLGHRPGGDRLGRVAKNEAGGPHGRMEARAQAARSRRMAAMSELDRGTPARPAWARLAPVRGMGGMLARAEAHGPAHRRACLAPFPRR